MKDSYPSITDQFCGAGGSSIGATLAGGEVRLAMNHWDLAVKTHNTNFPNADHVCADVSSSDPRYYPSTRILITSPECTNHSLAKGVARRLYERDLFGKVFIDPAAERSRATMLDVPRFAEYHQYDIIVVENVVDAANWVQFDTWLMMMHNLDYQHEVVYFNSMFAMPTPQSRDRMYIVFWKKGIRKPDLSFSPIAHCLGCGKDVAAIQTWKKKRKWGRYKSQYFYRCPGCNQRVEPYYYAALNAIDWTIKAERIGDRKKPLKPKTLARVKYGFEKFGRTPLIVTGRYTSGIDCRVKDAMTDVIPTQPGDSSHAIALPWMVETEYSHSGDNRVKDGASPMPTQPTRQSVGVVSPFVVETDFTKGNGSYTKSGTDALPTQSTRPALGIVSPYVVDLAHTKNDGNHAYDATGTIPTQTSAESVAVVAPGFLSKQYGGGADPKSMGIGMDNPTGAITTQDHHAVIGFPESGRALVSPSFIANMRGGGSTASGVDDPLLCVTSTGSHHALLSTNAFLSYYYGTHQGSGMIDPIHTMTGLDRAALIGALEKMTIEDLTFRMLAPKEIGAAMAFPSTYKVLGTNREMTKQYGNAVTPPVMQMIISRCLEVLD